MVTDWLSVSFRGLELNVVLLSFQAQQDMKKCFDTERIQFQDMLAENKQSFEAIIAGLQVENKALFEQNCELESKLR
jgi:hypothetical protein